MGLNLKKIYVILTVAIEECGLEAAKRPTAGVATGALRCDLLPSTLVTINKFYFSSYKVTNDGRSRHK